VGAGPASREGPTLAPLLHGQRWPGIDKSGLALAPHPGLGPIGSEAHIPKDSSLFYFSLRFSPSLFKPAMKNRKKKKYVGFPAS
jgi:hypothetical protein